MGVIAVNEIPDKRRADIDKNGIRTYSRAWRIQFDTPTNAGIMAILALPIYHYESYRDADFTDLAALALVPRAYPENPPDSFFWIVEVDYSTEIWDELAKRLQTGGGGNVGNRPNSPFSPNPGDQSPQNPLNWPFKISVSRIGQRRVMTEDVNGKPIANSAGDRFDPPYEVDEKIRRIVITRNEILTSSRVNLYDDYMDVVNEDEFLGYAAGSVLCKGIDYESETQNGYTFFVVTYEFWVKLHANPHQALSEIWKFVPLDEGFHEIDEDGFRKHIKDKHGINVSQPVLLDGKGFELLPDANGIMPPPVFLDGTAGTLVGPFQIYNTRLFSRLNIFRS